MNFGQNRSGNVLEEKFVSLRSEAYKGKRFVHETIKPS